MPVTAKLSLKVYERLGDDVVGELVGWFNAVDAAYQNQYRLRAMNDLNWERCRAELQSRRVAIRAELRTEIPQLRGGMSPLRNEMSRLRGDMSDIRVELSRIRTDFIKLVFIYWTATAAADAMLLWAILHR